MCKLTQKLRLLLSRKKKYLFYVAKCEVPLNFDYATCSTLYVHNELRPLLFPQSISTQNSQLNKRKINENRTNKLCILAFFFSYLPFCCICVHFPLRWVIQNTFCAAEKLIKSKSSYVNSDHFSCQWRYMKHILEQISEITTWPQTYICIYM